MNDQDFSNLEVVVRPFKPTQGQAVKAQFDTPEEQERWEHTTALMQEVIRKSIEQGIQTMLDNLSNE